MLLQYSPTGVLPIVNNRMVSSFSVKRKKRRIRPPLPVLLLALFLPLTPAGTPLSGQENRVELPRGFRDILLGLEFPVIEERVSRDSAFAFRGRPDVSMALSDGEPLIDTRGRGYVDRGVFSFHENRLFSFSLYLETQRLDYIQLYNHFSEKYGQPVDLDPRRAVWDDGRTRIELEKPLTLRYLDVAVFEERRTDSRAAEAVEDLTRRQFLELF
jgi:hypothetical protein